ncbi:MAG: metallophosphoesterase, partial [Romboutsia sp.]|nr:metallophosphoesterase [Romboutsia sp.]
PLTLANDFLLKLSLISPTFLIIGNHDRPNNSDFLSGYHPFSALKEWKNMYVVDVPVEARIGKFRFIFVPYVFPGRFMEALNKRPNPLSFTKCIFAHQEFKAAKMGAILSEKGDDWSLANPLVVSGHIHDYDELQPNLIYTGTPMQHAFGDKSDKTISILTFNDNGFIHRRTELDLIKRIIKTITIPEIYTFVPPSNVLLRLNIRGTAPDIKSIEKLDIIANWKKSGIKVNFVFITNTEEDSSVHRIAVSYKDELENAIKNDPLQSLVYKELFLTMDNKIKVENNTNSLVVPKMIIVPNGQTTNNKVMNRPLLNIVK